jgi:hypothetical protein
VSGAPLGRIPAPSSRKPRVLPLRIAFPPMPSHQLEAVHDKYRGFRRALRCLAIDTAVAWPADNGPHPVHLRPICL